jgi:hypothetical protein
MGQLVVPGGNSPEPGNGGEIKPPKPGRAVSAIVGSSIMRQQALDYRNCH